MLSRGQNMATGRVTCLRKHTTLCALDLATDCDGIEEQQESPGHRRLVPMKSQHWYAFLTALLFPTLAIAKVPPIKNIFWIDLRKPSEQQSSCLPHGNKLGVIWAQSHEMTTNVMEALSKEKYNEPNQVRTRKLLYSFFGISPKNTLDSRGHEYSTEEITRLQQQGRGEPENTYNRKLSAVRGNYEVAHDIITYEQKDGPDKPRIMCDSTFLELQRANDEVKDANGKSIPKDPKRPGGEKWKLKDWEQTKGRRNFESKWYFWYTFYSERGYFVLPKSTFPGTAKADAPWDLDLRTGKPSACLEDDGGWIFSPLDKPTPVPRDDKSAPWSEAQWMVLCPSSWQGRASLTLPKSPPPEGASIETLELTAMTFYHELWHLVDAKIIDWNRVRPIPGTDLTSKTHFTRDNLATKGGGETLLLGRWENARPVTRSYEAQTTKNAESYAWFGLTLWAQKLYDRDFSTGVCKKDSAGEVAQIGQSTKARRSTPTAA
ncbi:hypothetical protein BST61_g4213 [Cercospora zeina]